VTKREDKILVGTEKKLFLNKITSKLQNKKNSFDTFA
jgi:hypothetical protein